MERGEVMVRSAVERATTERATTIAAGLYLAVLLVIAWWPTHVDRDLDIENSWLVRGLTALGMSAGSGYGLVEFTANIALFVPWGMCAARFLAGRWAVAVLSGVVATVLVETVQWLLLAGRTASLGDVVANSLGTAIGVAAVVWWTGRASR